MPAQYHLPEELKPAPPPAKKGLVLAITIWLLWVGCQAVGMNILADYTSPFSWLLFFTITHLYTGLFITAHDAMHGLAHPKKSINNVIGTISSGLFAFNNFFALRNKHGLHHKYAATPQDPDYYAGSFWPWYISFVRQYVTWWQILAMAIAYNVLKIWIPASNLIFFWMAPAILSTFQLFYFGTYLPHKGHHHQDDPHKANSQPLNHFWAFITCYNFGYHHEHHAMPHLPWYKLTKAREFSEKNTHKNPVLH